MLVLQKGRPENFNDRLDKEKRCYEFLDKLGIEYYRVDHEVTDTMELCAEIDLILGAPTCKNLFLTNRQRTSFYLLMIPADKPFKTKDISAQIGSARLSFAGGEDMERMLDITPGSLSVMGLINDVDRDVTLLFDEDLLKNEYIGFHPCVNTTTLKVKTKDLLEKIIPAATHTITYVNLPRYEEKDL